MQLPDLLHRLVRHHTAELSPLIAPPAARAARGARYLDVCRPGWWWAVTRPVFIASCEGCVLGQVYGDYAQAPAPLRDAAYTLGFMPILGDVRQLDQAWEAEIARRRSPDPQPAGESELPVGEAKLVDA